LLKKFSFQKYWYEKRFGRFLDLDSDDCWLFVGIFQADGAEQEELCLYAGCSVPSSYCYTQKMSRMQVPSKFNTVKFLRVTLFF
jgi:hypothetical protein